MAIKKTFFEWPIHKIIAYTVAGKIASNKSLEKAGFIEKLSTNKKNASFMKNR